MAEVTTPPIPTEPIVFRGRRLALGAAVVAVLGFVVLAIGLAINPARTWLSYLWAYWFVLSTSVGGLVLLMSGYATNARWMSVVRRPTEAVALPLPALAVLFIPLLFGLSWIYPWRGSHALSHHELSIVEHRAPYLNLAFFVIRGAIYFAVFITASYLLRRWSVRRDREGDAVVADPEAALARERKLASAMLPPVGLALTFAGFDWVMSLEPVWYSSMFGFYVFAGGFLAAIAIVTLLAQRLWNHQGGDGVITRNHFHALGRLLFAFVVFWTYIAFFQAMLIRIANKPEEVTFYLTRLAWPWTPLSYLLILGHFAVPFLFLLPKRIKFRPKAMAGISIWLVVMHLVDTYWLVIPARPEGWLPHWLDVGALAAVVGTAVAVAAWRQDGVSTIPIRDPFLAKGAAYWSKL